MAEQHPPSAAMNQLGGKIAAIVVAAALAELGIRSLAPLPHAPTLPRLAVSLLLYALAALPALLLATRVRPHLLRGAILGLPLALLAVNLAFASGSKSGVGLSLAAVAGLCLGTLLSRMRTRRILVVGAVAGLAFLWTAAIAPQRAADGSQPSVLFVVLDTTSAKHLSTYGYGTPTSPHLSALAQRGLLYRRAVANAPWTLPSHASIFSGLLPSDLGFDGAGFDADVAIGSIAGDLARTGRTACAISANPMIPGIPRLREGFDRVWGVQQLTQPMPIVAFDRLRRREGFQSRGERVTDLALDWIDHRSAKDRPWFLFLNYLDPHAPYQPPQRAKDQFAAGIDPGMVSRDTQDYNSGRLPLTPAVRNAIHALYDAEVAAADAALGRLLTELRARGYGDSNLLVIVTADHGESLGEHGFIGHMLGMPDVVLHVPLVMTGPGIQPGEVEEPVHLVQIRATLRVLFHLPAVDAIAPALPPWGPAPALLIAEHPEPRWYGHELAEFNPGGERESLGSWVALQQGTLKSVFDAQGRGVAYDLSRDPDELNPLPLRDGHALLQAYVDRPAAQPARKTRMSEETRWALRQLGYLSE